VSTETFWLGRAALALAIAALGLALAREFGEHGWLRRRVARTRVSLRAELNRLGLRTSAESLLALTLILAGATLIAALLGQHLLALCLVPTLAAPRLWLARARTRRRAALERQLEAWLGALGNALAATPALGDALASSAGMVDAPLRDELELVLKETALGMPLDDALERAGARGDSRLLRGLVTTLKVARNTGGNLPTTLAAACESLREMSRLEGVVRTKTAEGRVQTVVLAALPAVLYYLLVALRPDHFEPMDRSTFGGLLYLAAGTLWVSAVLGAHRILSVDL
jgi:tight adherence protein B